MDSGHNFIPELVCLTIPIFAAEMQDYHWPALSSVDCTLVQHRILLCAVVGSIEMLLTNLFSSCGCLGRHMEMK